MDFFAEWLADLGIDSETTVMESNKLTNVIIDGDYDAFEWGWYVEPDPDSLLAYLICDQRGGWNDSWWCNEEYDALYEQQNGEMDDATRQDLVKQMQELYYYNAPVPGDGVHLGRRGLPQRQVGVPPAAAGPGRDPADPVRHPQLPEHQAGRRGRRLRRGRDRAGRGWVAERRRWRRGRRRELQHGVLVGGGVLLAALVIGGGVCAMRRRGTAADRE